MKLAVQVAAKVVGLTNSKSEGMVKRLNALLHMPPLTEGTWLQRALKALGAQLKLLLLRFYWHDVRPAIKARQTTAQHDDYADVINYLLSEKYNHIEVTIECVTYGAAGMVTTREFIAMAAWHLLQQDDLRQRYLHADHKERQLILHEILRLEPIVSHLYRRASEAIDLQDGEQVHKIAAGDLLELDITAADADATVVGEQPLEVCPHIERAKGVQPPVMAFGDGAHRCPGAFIAIEESDVFLQQLLALPLEIVQKPTVSWNHLIQSYQVEGLIIKLMN